MEMKLSRSIYSVWRWNQFRIQKHACWLNACENHQSDFPNSFFHFPTPLLFALLMMWLGMPFSGTSLQPIEDRQLSYWTGRGKIPFFRIPVEWLQFWPFGRNEFHRIIGVVCSHVCENKFYLYSVSLLSVVMVVRNGSTFCHLDLESTRFPHKIFSDTKYYGWMVQLVVFSNSNFFFWQTHLTSLFTVLRFEFRFDRIGKTTESQAGVRPHRTIFGHVTWGSRDELPKAYQRIVSIVVNVLQLWRPVDRVHAIQKWDCAHVCVHSNPADIEGLTRLD